MASNNPISLVSYGYNTDDSDSEEGVLATKVEEKEDIPVEVQKEPNQDPLSLLSEYKNDEDDENENMSLNESIEHDVVQKTESRKPSKFAGWHKDIFGAPTHLPSSHLQQRVEELHESRKAGNSFNRSLRKSELYNRPGGLKVLMEKFSVHQHSTHFDVDKYDPNRFEKRDEYPVLAEEFERYLKELSEKQSHRKQIQFTRGGV